MKRIVACIVAAIALLGGAVESTQPAQAEPSTYCVKVYYSTQYGSVPAGVRCYNTNKRYRRVADCNYVVGRWTYYGPTVTEGMLSKAPTGPTCTYRTQWLS